MIKFFIFLIIFIVLYNLYFYKIEKFGFPYWNIGTRFSPSYDIRGYIYNTYPLLLVYPYFYTTNGKYIYDKKLKNEILSKIK